MGEGVLRNPPTGAIVGRRGVCVLPAQIAVAASSTGSGTFSFEGVEVGDNVNVNFRGALGNVGAPLVFVAEADHIHLVFATGGAALTIPTQSFDVVAFDF
jgi:hypothetical protein